MSTQIKLIIPLIDEPFIKEDFTQDAGFVDAFLNNKNAPHLLNHLFLLYKAEDRTYHGAVVMSKIQSMKSLYSWKTIKIGGHYYTLYIISLIGSKMKNLIKGIPSFEQDDIEKTLKFWNLEDSEVNKIMLGVDSLLVVDDKSVPEEDYSHPDLTTESGYKEALAIENDSQGFFCKRETLQNIIKTTFHCLFFLERLYFFFLLSLY